MNVEENLKRILDYTIVQCKLLTPEANHNVWVKSKEAIVSFYPNMMSAYE